MFCDVKLCRRHASLTVSYIGAVNPNIKRRFYAIKMNKYFTPFPINWNGKFSPIRPNRIIITIDFWNFLSINCVWISNIWINISQGKNIVHKKFYEIIQNSFFLFDINEN